MTKHKQEQNTVISLQMPSYNMRLSKVFWLTFSVHF